MSKFFENLIALTIIPISILNLLGGLVGGIWLIIVGEWQLALWSFLITIFFSWIYSLATMIVTFPMMFLITHLADKKHALLVSIAGFINMLISNCINLFWVFYVINIAFSISGINIIPLILVGYAVATGGFAYMASKEPKDSTGTYVAVYLTQISYIIGVVLALLNLGYLIIPIFIIFALICSIFLARVAYLTMKFETALNIE